MFNHFRTLYFKFVSPEKRAKLLGVKFGNNCKFSKCTKFSTEPYLIEIGDNFYSSRSIEFITHDGSVNVLRNKFTSDVNIDMFGKIKIGNNVFLGYDVCVLPGSVIGDNVIIGAKSLVKGTLLSNSIYAGVPAKYICSLDEFRKKNSERFHQTKPLTAQKKRKYLERHEI